MVPSAPPIYKTIIGLVAFSILFPSAGAAPTVDGTTSNIVRSEVNSGSSSLEIRDLFGLQARGEDYNESCEDFDAWDDDKEALNSDSSKRDLSNLEKRSTGKKIRACDDKIAAKTRDYPGPSAFFDEKKMEPYLKDLKSFNFKTPKDCSDFTFGSVTSPTKKDDATGYDSEHVLEVQLVTQFIDDQSATKGSTLENPDPNSSSKINLCAYMEPYWADLPDDKKIKEINGEKLSEKKAEQAIKWIAAQFPQNGEGHFEEFVFLQKKVNSLKGNIWGGNQVTDETNRKVMAKSIKLDGKDDKTILTDYKKATQKWKDILAVWKYHQDSNVKGILRKQAKRVGEMFGSLEDELPKINFEKEFSGKKEKMPTYKSQSLKDAWYTFMKTRNDEIITTTDNWLKKWKDEMVDKKDDLKKKQDDKKTSSNNKKSYGDLITIIENLEKAYNNKGTWKNAFSDKLY
ncbi:hypothetical protein K490DRAFT_57536 [Saccharata proteae CBS 121410]|uniref:Uncharacterized protein n=1 Tax=Saccharata proteae CBS 121410 TaxID=1314787 RepID=A0A9P4HRH6_9PEZI|nr:hypothetical protein K490DRAFT_57536 [Saccharata proteae CBS 121410]